MTAGIHMPLREKELEAVSLIKERYPHITSSTDAVRASLMWLAFGETPVKEVSVNDEWVTVKEAARILTENSENNHTITEANAYRIARAGLITTIRISGKKGRGGQQLRFKAADCYSYHVKQNTSYNFPYKGKKSEPKEEAVTE